MSSSRPYVSGASIRIPAGARLGVAGLGAIFITQIIFLNLGTRYTTASRSTLLICAHPIFVALSAHILVPGDRLNLTKVAGLLLSFGGLALVFLDSVNLPRHLLGDALVLGSDLLLGLRQVVIKRLVHDLHPHAVLFWQAAPSLPVFALLSLLLEREATYNWSPAVIGALLYQGLIVAGLCFIIWVFLLRRHSATRLGAFGFATPIFGVFLSALLFDDVLTWPLLLSMVLVAMGIAVVNRAAA